MVLEIATFNNVKLGLERRIGDKFEFEGNTFAFNMDARISSDNLWGTWLDSRTMVLYGGQSKQYDNRHVFKIDPEFSLSTIMKSAVQFNGAISIDEKTYTSSTGTEFIVIDQKDIGDAKRDFAIRADKYEAVREQLSKGSVDVETLVKVGGFKVNQSLSSDEVIIYDKSKKTEKLSPSDIGYVHDGWLELAVGKNRASAEDYQTARVRLARYTKQAETMNCFRNNNGMALCIKTNNNELGLRPLFVNYSNEGSNAYGKTFFFWDEGHFLRIHRVEATKVNAAQSSRVG